MPCSAPTSFWASDALLFGRATRRVRRFEFGFGPFGLLAIRLGYGKWRKQPNKVSARRRASTRQSTLLFHAGFLENCSVPFLCWFS